jgi:hypothetical protein
VFVASAEGVTGEAFDREDVVVLPLELPQAVRGYPFAAKVWACAWAEDLATSQDGPLGGGTVRTLANGRVRSLAWLAPDCLVIQPPALFRLGPAWDAAVRPVHIRNVGLRAGEALDPFWRGVYAAVGLSDVVPNVTTLGATVESYVDAQRLRAYYNSHGLAVDPALGLLRRWAEIFLSLVVDGAFQAAACQDMLHRVFLHQAALSALLATRVDPGRLRLLPPEYNYPYNLHGSVPEERRARALNDLVCIAYEDRSLDPDEMEDINVEEPLRSWLAARLATA